MKPFYPFFAAILCLFFFQSVQAQCQAKKGRCKKSNYWEVRAGAGLLPTFVKDRAQTLMPPVLLGLDYRLKPNISLGLQAGASVSEAPRKIPKKTDPAIYRNHYTVVGLRATAHTTTLDRWEVYGGMMAGYSISNIEVFDVSSEKSPELMDTYHKGEVYLSAFVGGRYAINRQIGVFSELGLGISVLSAGISWQFK